MWLLRWLGFLFVVLQQNEAAKGGRVLAFHPSRGFPRGNLGGEEGPWWEGALGQGAPCRWAAEQSIGAAAHVLSVKWPVGPPGEALGTARGQARSPGALEEKTAEP